jgi:hypothetical protein
MIEKEQFFSSLLSVSEIIKISKFKQLNNIVIIDNEDENKEEEKNFLETPRINELLNRTRKIYLEEFNFNDNSIKENFVENPGDNEIEIIFGIKLPGMKTIIESIIKKFKKEIFSLYKSNENSLRSNIDDEDINEKKKLYKDKLASFNDTINIELKKIIYYQKLLIRKI